LIYRVLTGGATALICGLCGWRSTRLGLGITPDSAVYHFQQWQAHAELSAELDLAIALNPRYTAAWIARGLRAESLGDRKTAEGNLLRAAAADRTYLPSWTLANFYLRAENLERFWNWASQAAGMAPDPTALFQLCWRASSDSGEILARVIPPSPRVRRAYLNFLLNTNRFEAAGPLADEFSRAPQDADLEPLLRYCDTALAKSESRPALKIWKALWTAHLVPHGENDALTNGDLASPPLARGFDWRPIPVAGATTSFDPTARQMTVSLSGRQPESCNLVEHYVVLQPGAGYKFRFRYATRELPAGNGLAWTFVDAKSGAEFAAAGIPTSGAVQTLEFSTPVDCGLARMLLRYRRPSGSVRAEGSIVFHGFTLERAR
jgi:tetratricopeptide (TPR) repeat protein